MSTRPRTPEYFPRMKHRAAKRQVVYLDIMPDLSGFIEAMRTASRTLAKRSQTTQAAPNRAAFPLSGEKS